MGKSSLIKRFIENTSDGGGPTIGAAEFRRRLYLNNSSQYISLQIWDVSGQDKFSSVTSMYYRDADACILVYDVADRTSLDHLRSTWLHNLKEKAPVNTITAVVGNKCDLHPKEVTEEEGEALTQECGALLHKLVSAKKNQGLNEVFQKLGEELLSRPSFVRSRRAQSGVIGCD